jgi:hypothetical protein
MRMIGLSIMGLGLGAAGWWAHARFQGLRARPDYDPLKFMDDYQTNNYSEFDTELADLLGSDPDMEGEWRSDAPTLEDELALDELREKEAKIKALRENALGREWNMLVAHWEDNEGWHLDDEQYADRTGWDLDYLDSQE